MSMTSTGVLWEALYMAVCMPGVLREMSQNLSK